MMHIILETYKNKAQVQTAKTHVQFPFVQTKCYEKKVDERARREYCIHFFNHTVSDQVRRRLLYLLVLFFKSKKCNWFSIGGPENKCIW